MKLTLNISRRFHKRPESLRQMGDCSPSYSQSEDLGQDIKQSQNKSKDSSISLGDAEDQRRNPMCAKLSRDVKQSAEDEAEALMQNESTNDTGLENDMQFENSAPMVKFGSYGT